MTRDDIIDLRSDTVTRPTPAMREAIARAEVGDDVFGDDPTVNRLQQRVAAMFDKEAALFVPSGTMANQVAIRSHTEPGNEIICHHASHIYNYEGGAPFALAGCSIRLLDGDRGIFTAEDVRAAVRPDDPHFPRSKLVIIENTQNRGGGSVWKLEDVKAIGETARRSGLKVHLDGARIMNACVATGLKPADYAAHCDSATICFSKGLGAPVGSALAGTREFIDRARRFRKMYGGGMRQAGVLAAAAEYALDHNVERLADDHANAARFAAGIRQCAPLRVIEPETNIVYFDVDPAWNSATPLAVKVHELGVWILAVSPHRIRAVMHLDVDAPAIDRAIETVKKAVGLSGRPTGQRS